MGQSLHALQQVRHVSQQLVISHFATGPVQELVTGLGPGSGYWFGSRIWLLVWVRSWLLVRPETGYWSGLLVQGRSWLLVRARSWLLVWGQDLVTGPGQELVTGLGPGSCSCFSVKIFFVFTF